jgi:hypothetical protein
MNNTITPRQVEALQRKIDQIASKAKTEIESSVADFYEAVSKNWADEKAVEMAEKVGRSMNGCIQSFETNSNKVKQGMVEIANAYARQAHKPTMNSSRLSFHPAVNPTVVHSEFQDGSYGIINDASKQAVLDAFTTLKGALKKCAQEAAQEYKSCYAYGIQDIQQGIARAGVSVVDGITNTIGTIETDVIGCIEGAKQGYNKIVDAGVSTLNSMKFDDVKVEKM